MDLSQVERLKTEQLKGLELCEDKTKQWEKFKNDYEQLKQHLQTLPDELSYDITVPFGSNAFCMGKLVHTNEVMVLLGDNWFVEVSGKQAIAIADRRIAQCSRMLDDLAAEKKQFQNWLNYIGEISNESLVEIVEKYDEEEEERKCRETLLKNAEQHSKNVEILEAQHKRLAEIKTKLQSSEKETNNLDDDYLAKLEKLQLEETPEQLEMSDSETNTIETLEQKELTESDESIHESSDNVPEQVEIKNTKSSLKLDISFANEQKSFHESESGEDDGNKSDDLNANLENFNTGSNSKHVRWQDESKQNIKKITFKHSKSKYHPKRVVKRQDSSESDEVQPLIQSPSDIYKHFESLFQATSPKSILKVKNSPTTPENNQSFFPVDEIVPKDASSREKSENIVNAFTGKVYEHSSPTHISEKKSSSRPVSHFKNSRKSRKR